MSMTLSTAAAFCSGVAVKKSMSVQRQSHTFVGSSLSDTQNECRELEIGVFGPEVVLFAVDVNDLSVFMGESSLQKVQPILGQSL